MRPPKYLGSALSRCCPHNGPSRRQARTIASHTYKHHAATISVLPTNVDKLSSQYQENARQMGEVMARMQELHRKIQEGGSPKTREKHVARGKMLPREYVNKVQ